MSATTVSLQRYLDGVLFDQAQKLFERGLDPMVRQAMRDAFPEDPQDPVVLQHAADKVASAARIQQLDTHELPAAAAEVARLNGLSCTDKAAKKALKTEYKAAEKMHTNLLKERDSCHVQLASSPLPRWLRECKKLFGHTMVHHINDRPVIATH